MLPILFKGIPKEVDLPFECIEYVFGCIPLTDALNCDSSGLFLITEAEVLVTIFPNMDSLIGPRILETFKFIWFNAALEIFNAVFAGIPLDIK